MIIDGMKLELMTRDILSVVTQSDFTNPITVTGDCNYRVVKIDGNAVCSPVILISGYGQGMTRDSAVCDLELRCLNDAVAVFRDMYSNS